MQCARAARWRAPTAPLSLTAWRRASSCKAAKPDLLPPQLTTSVRIVLCICSVRAPRAGGRDRAPEPHGLEAREFLRKKFIGKDVTVKMEYTRKIGPMPGQAAAAEAPAADVSGQAPCTCSNLVVQCHMCWCRYELHSLLYRLQKQCSGRLLELFCRHCNLRGLQHVLHMGSCLESHIASAVVAACAHA